MGDLLSILRKLTNYSFDLVIKIVCMVGTVRKLNKEE